MSHNQAFFEPEAITVMTTAFEETLHTLGLVDHTGLAAEIARKSLSLRSREKAILSDCETAPFNLCRCKGEMYDPLLTDPSTAGASGLFA